MFRKTSCWSFPKVASSLTAVADTWPVDKAPIRSRDDDIRDVNDAATLSKESNDWVGLKPTRSSHKAPPSLVLSSISSTLTAYNGKDKLCYHQNKVREELQVDSGLT